MHVGEGLCGQDDPHLLWCVILQTATAFKRVKQLTLYAVEDIKKVMTSVDCRCPAKTEDWARCSMMSELFHHRRLNRNKASAVLISTATEPVCVRISAILGLAT
jgi:hypothetical protein